MVKGILLGIGDSGIANKGLAVRDLEIAVGVRPNTRPPAGPRAGARRGLSARAAASGAVLASDKR